jgi:hypothetical protein
VGGALGLSSLLSNLEASAEGAPSPPRFLLVFWPGGTIPYLFRPTGAGREYVPSSILQPFEAAGLREEVAVLYGLRDTLTPAGGGGSEGGVVLRMTCVASPGTRVNGGEPDDSVAGGPSIDQILSKWVPELRPRVPELGPLNVICDARVDANEISAQCLSYSYEQRTIDSSYPGGTITENTPLMPELSPLQLYTKLFVGMMPGGSTDANRLELAKALQLRKSVLDYSLGELDRLRGLAPASEREKIEIHAQAIRRVEQELSAIITQSPGVCAVPAPPDAELRAPAGSEYFYGNPLAEADESAALLQVGKAHLGLIRAAFQCDLARVATFQWCSATAQCAFGGLYPGQPEAAYRQHPLSHAVGLNQLETQPAVAEQRAAAEFLANVHTWYNRHTADLLTDLRNATDVFGGTLLDHTIVPLVTEIATPAHTRSPLPALVCGGRALGVKGGQYLDMTSSPRPFTDVWLTLLQAYLPDADLAQLLADETFMQQGGDLARISELWQRPA